ncbi:MAG: type II toxin-antitoxin system RelE/ParE family toxin [Rhizobiaceae bacterium]|nr:type II toxin-antitoxin system RelE/ParE family toxin [Rhizobiaceae bacterium]
MPRFRLTKLAESDFDQIGSYTLENWGEVQATLYLSQLDETFHLLANTPALGRDVGDLRSGMLSCPCNRHIVFFRRDAGGNVEILRILHERMDFVRHL